MFSPFPHLHGDSFKKVKSYIYTHCPNGFYVRAKPNKCPPNHVIKYIGRPVISTKRIDSYDGTNVTFHYNRHEDDKLMVETIPALEFIEQLIQHIPEKHFKTILSFNRWRDCILFFFGYNPLVCPKCHKTMTFLELYFKHNRVSLHEMYEKVMIKNGFHT